jgi:large subunit ribosomal protein L10
VVFHRKDVIGLAKLLVDINKGNPNFAFKAALVEGKVVPTSEIQALASMPSREVMLSKLAFLLKAPLQRLDSVLKAPLRNLGLVLKQVQK